MLSERARSWRRKAKRGVSPIIATILLVAITVVLAAVLYILISGLVGGGNPVPLGTAWALGAPLEGTAGPNFYYNFSVESASNGIIVNNLIFQIKTTAGTLITGTSVTIIAATGCTVAVYSFSSNSWAPSTLANKCTGSSGSTQASVTAPYAAGEVVALLTTSAVSGDSLVSVGQGHFQGTVTVSIT